MSTASAASSSPPPAATTAVRSTDSTAALCASTADEVTELTKLTRAPTLTAEDDRRAQRASQLAALLEARRDNLSEAQQIQTDLEAARDDLEPPLGSDPAAAESTAADFRERLRRLRAREEKLMATQVVWEQSEASYAAEAAAASATSASAGARLSASQIKRKKKKERAAAQKKRENEGGAAAASGAAASSDADDATAAAASSAAADSSKPRAAASLRDYSYHALESLLRNDTASLSVLLASTREGGGSGSGGTLGSSGNASTDPDHLSTLHALQALGPAGHPQSFTEGLHSLLARLQRQGLVAPSSTGGGDASVYSDGEVEEDLREETDEVEQQSSQSQQSERSESKSASVPSSSSTLALANIARKVFRSRSRSASTASIDEEVEEEESAINDEDDSAAAASSGAGSSSSSMFAQPGEIELFCAMLEYASASAHRSKAKSGEGDSLISLPTSSTGRAVAAALGSSVRSSRSASASSHSRLADGEDGSQLLLPDAQLARLIDQSLSGLANWEDSQASDSAAADEGGSSRGSLVSGVHAASMDANCDFSLNAASLQSFAHVLCKCADNVTARSTTQSPTQTVEAPTTTHSSSASASRRRSASAAASPASKSSSLSAASSSQSSSLTSLMSLPHDGTVQMTLCHTCGMFRVKDDGALPPASSSAASAAAASSAGPLPVPALATPARPPAEATLSKQHQQAPTPSKQLAGSTPSKPKSAAADSSTPTPKQAKKKQQQQSAAATATTADKTQSDVVSPPAASAAADKRTAASESTTASSAAAAPSSTLSAPVTPAAPAAAAAAASGSAGSARCSNSCSCCETLSKHLASFAQLQQRVASLENHVKQERKSLNERLRPLDKIDSTLRSQSQTVQRGLDEERRARIESDALFRQSIEARLDEMAKSVAESKASAAAASATATHTSEALAALPASSASDPPASVTQLHSLEDALTKLSKRLAESTRLATAHATAAREEMEANWSKRMQKMEKAIEAQAARCKQQYAAMPLLQQQSHAPPLLPSVVAAAPAAAAPASAAVSASALSNVTAKLTSLQHRLDSSMAALESWKKQQLEQQAAQIAAAVVAALQAASNTSPSSAQQQQQQQQHPARGGGGSSSLHHVFSPPSAGSSLSPPSAESLWGQPPPQQQQTQQQQVVAADDYPFSDDSVLPADELDDDDDDTVGATHGSAARGSFYSSMFAPTVSPNSGGSAGPSLTPYAHATNGLHHAAQPFRPGQSRTLTMLGLQEQ